MTSPSSKEWGFRIEEIGNEFPLLRRGSLQTPHGTIQTPAFLPVATQATLKGIKQSNFELFSIQGILANTYHLFLRPGPEIIEQSGGLHNFMNYNGPIMTDSGGFQVFSLGDAFGKGVTKVSKDSTESSIQQRSLNVYASELATAHGKLAILDDEGVTFTSHIDGSLHRFSAERSIEIQHQLGADIIVAFDECTSPLRDYDYQLEALERTHKWAIRSLKAHRQNLRAAKKQALYGVIQGGRFLDLREKSAQFFSDHDFDGYAIGGSFTKDDLGEPLQAVNQILPEEKPRHLLGIGEPEDIFIAVERGVDTFDCVQPTRLGRVGTLYTRDGKVNLTKSALKTDTRKLSDIEVFHQGPNYNLAYLHHLFRTKEMLGPIIISELNVQFLTSLMRDIRDSIQNNTFASLKNEFLTRYNKT